MAGAFTPFSDCLVLFILFLPECFVCNRLSSGGYHFKNKSDEKKAL